MTAPSLKIGVLFDARCARRWQIDLLEQLSTAPEAFRIVALVPAQDTARNDAKTGDGAAPLLSRLAARVRESVFAAANALDQVIARKVGRALVEVDTPVPLDGCFAPQHIFPHGLLSNPEHPGSACNEDDLAWFTRLELDLLLHLGTVRLSETVLDVPRLGVLAPDDASDTQGRRAPAGFREFCDNEPVTRVVLRRLEKNRPRGTVVASGHFQANNLSWNMNRRRMVDLGIHLVVDAVKKAARDGFVESADDFDRDRATPPREAPAVRRTLVAVAKLVTRWCGLNLRSRLFPVVWELRLIKGEPLDVEGRDAVPARAPRSRFWADPFIVKREGRWCVFVEDFDFRQDIGKISVLDLDPQTMRVGPAEVVLDCGYHLSHPFLFEFQGRLYMVPESCKSGSVELFECTRFPREWVKVGNLLEDISAADTSIFAADGLWWLLTNVSRSRRLVNHNNELHAYWAEDPVAGPWTPHRNNPVIRDARVARNAGGVIRHPQFGLLRVSQINGIRYGEGVNINRILTLTPSEYAEERLWTVRPQWARGFSAFHHMSSFEGVTVCDVGRRRMTFGIRRGERPAFQLKRYPPPCPLP